MAWIDGRIMRAGLLAVALGVAGGSAAPAQAQAGLLGPGAAFFGAGVSRTGTGELDDRLGARGYPVFGRTAGAVSMGAYRILRSGVTLGAEWHGLILGEEEHQGREVGLGGGYGTLGVGYMVEISPRTRLYPRLGLGGGGMGVWIESGDETVDFDEVLADPEGYRSPRGATVLSRGSAVVDLGMGAEFLPRGRGPLIGLRIGYLAAPAHDSWQLEGEFTNGSAVSGGPVVTLAGAYIRVVVGAGWRR